MVDLELEYKIFTEYLLLLIDNISSELKKAVLKSYNERLYKEKIKYSQSKEYHTKKRKIENSLPNDYGINEQLSKLDYWTSTPGERAKNDSHITYYENNKYRVDDSEFEPYGFEPQLSLLEYYEKVSVDIYNKSQNDLVTLILTHTKTNFINCLVMEDDRLEDIKSVLFEQFRDMSYNLHITSFVGYYKEIDEFISSVGIKVFDRNKISYCCNYYITTNQIIPKDRRWNVNFSNIISDRSEIRIKEIESKSESYMLVSKNIYPEHERIVGKKIGDEITLGNKSYIVIEVNY